MPLLGIAYGVFFGVSGLDAQELLLEWDLAGRLAPDSLVRVTLDAVLPSAELSLGSLSVAVMVGKGAVTDWSSGFVGVSEGRVSPRGDSLVVAAVNADPGANRGRVRVLDAEVRVTGTWGDSLVVRVEGQDAATVDFVPLPLQIAPSRRSATIAPGPIALRRDTVRLIGGRSTSVILRASLEEPRAAVGAGRVVLNSLPAPADSVVSGFEEAVVAWREDEAGAVEAAWAGGHGLPRPDQELVEVFLSPPADGPRSGELQVSVLELFDWLETRELTPYIPETSVRIPFLVDFGTWGDVDPLFDGAPVIGSSDALACLKVAVDLVIPSSMDPTACDVFPDGGTYRGMVTARDALGILSYAVSLPTPGLRVGEPR
jgi:hypothetical protein